MSIVGLSLSVVCTPAANLAAAGRFAQPPWDHDSPDWQRIDHKLPSDHLARRIDRAVARLDLAGLFAAYSGRGSLASRPDLLLKVALFEYQRGRRSPAVWHEDLLTDEACQWLALGLRPARSKLYAFHDRLGQVLDELHQGLIGTAVRAGLCDATQAALDGTAVAAHASRHRLLNAATLAKRQQALAEAVAADQVAAPSAASPAWMATTPAGRHAQHQRYRQAHEQLAVRLQENRQRPKSKRLADKDVRISPSDPEAALGLDKLKVFGPLYTVQLMPDVNTPLVLAYEVFAQATDAATLPTMLQRCRQATGHYPADLLTDTAYAKALDLAACQQAGVTLYAPCPTAGEPGHTPGAAAQATKQIPKSAFVWHEAEQVYVCPEGHPLRYWCAEYEKRKGGERLRMLAFRCAPAHCQACPRQQACTRSPERGRMVKRSEYEPLVEALGQRMQKPEARTLCKRRCQTVELGFADQKEHRGLRRFRGRGRSRARIEVGLVVLAHNALAARALHDEKNTLPPPVSPQPASG